MPIKPLIMSDSYDEQRFLQFSPASCSNWYAVESASGKQKKALYPVLGRKHLTASSTSPNIPNPFVYVNQPTKIFKSIDYVYVVVDNVIYQIDSNFVQRRISQNFFWNGEDLNFAFLPVVQGSRTTPSSQTQAVFCMFCTGERIYVYHESANSFTEVDDPLKPNFPLYVAAFGNRFVVSSRNSTQFQLTQVNMGGNYNKTNVFTIAGKAVFAQESGIIRQMAVLHQQLYMFTDYTTGIWSNTPSVFVASDATSTFPWKKNTSYDFDYGIADPHSLDVDFGMMVWLGQNRNGLVTFLSSNGQSPNPISSQAINVLIQRIANAAATQSLLNLDTSGFLYQYEDTVFYRASVGPYSDVSTLDNDSLAKCIEYNFNTQTWHLCTELNGQRSLVEDHVFFNNKHIVTALGQTCLYDFSGNYYFNETQTEEDPYTWVAYPMRYENVTPIISEPDYSEFITDYIQIDFVFGEQSFIHADSNYENTVFLIAERGMNGEPVYLVSENGEFLIKDGTNTPTLADLNSPTYSDLFKPHIELYWSDDGGVSFNSADVLEFSQLGVYQWRMRWNQAGASRNRVYKLICVSPSPIVILGAVQDVRRASGGAN
jgi:hypothetical protein